MTVFDNVSDSLSLLHLLTGLVTPRLGPESSLMGDRRHKDEVDSADDSDGGRGEGEEEASTSPGTGQAMGYVKKSPGVGLSPAPDIDKVGLGWFGGVVLL